jgi:hypothetical protein
MNATASLRELGNDFRLEAKPIFFKLNRFGERGFERFSTSVRFRFENMLESNVRNSLPSMRQKKGHDVVIRP